MNLTKSAKSLFFLMALFSSQIIYGTTFNDIMRNIPSSYSGIIDYSVTQPMTNQDISYKVKVYSIINKTDTLSRCNYLIEYQPESESLPNFSSYFNGHYYNFSNDKLREYHWEWDSIPMMRNFNTPGVQNSGLFNSLLPQNLYSNLKILSDNPDNKIQFVSDTIIYGIPASTIKIKEYIHSVLARIHFVAFDKKTNLPIYYELTNNPEMMSEQSVTAKFAINHWSKGIKLTEEGIVERYADVFNKYRINNFTIENMPGKKLPLFNLPTLDNSRCSYEGSFPNPTLIVFLEEGNGANSVIINSVKKAINSLNEVTDIIWIYGSNKMEAIKEEVNKYNVPSPILTRGDKFATQCGINGYPTLLFLNKEGIVTSVQLGVNNDMENIVIQKAVLINSYK